MCAAIAAAAARSDRRGALTPGALGRGDQWCTSLDVCGLFEPAPRAAPALDVSHVGATR
jgi:hypothetical protein